MSRQHLIFLLVCIAGGERLAAAQAETQTPAAAVVAELLAADNYLKAESILDEGNPELADAERLAYRGEVEFRKGHFDTAAEYYRLALAANPETARAHDGLGKLAMAKLRLPAAIESFKQAIALDTNEPLYRLHASDAFGAVRNVFEQRKQLAEYIRLQPKDAESLAQARTALETLDALKNQEIARIEAPEELAQIFLAQGTNLVFVQVLINGKGPFIFALDSGAAITAISKAAAEKSGLQPVTSTAPHGIDGGDNAESRLYRLDTLQIGNVKIHNLPAGALSDPTVALAADGIIGTSLLSEFRMTIDFVQDRMDLIRITDPPAPSPEDAIPAWNFANLLLVPVTVNDHAGNFLVDTGAAASILSYSMAAALGITPETPDATMLIVEEVRIATLQTTERRPKIFAIDLKEMSRTLGTEISGILGHDAFEGYALTLDYSKPEIHFTGGIEPQQ